MPRRGNNSDERLIALFLDMLAAERGAGKNTLAAYAHDLGDLSAHLATNGSTIANATTDELRGYLGALAKRGLKIPSVARPPATCAPKATCPALFSTGSGCAPNPASVPPPGKLSPNAATFVTCPASARKMPSRAGACSTVA